MSNRDTGRKAHMRAGGSWRVAALSLGVAACGGGGPTDVSGTAACGTGDVALAVGQSCAISGAAATEFVLAAGDGPREYVLAVQSADRQPGALTPIEMSVRATGAGAAIASGDLSAAVLPMASPAGVSSAAPEDLELTLRRNAMEALRRANARPIRGRSPAESLPAALAARTAQPAEGDTLTVKNSVAPNLGVDCNSETTITAVVRSLGEGFALAEDTAVAGQFTESDWAFLVDELQRYVFPIDTAYFGSPADIDGNGRVIVLFTADVNRLSRRGSGTFIAGFFNPSDLAENCAASNRAEILYLLAPDAAGRFGDPRPVDFARQNARAVIAHELLHLVTAEQRAVLGGGSLTFDLEDAWLSEGMAHTAETLVGLRRAGLPLGANLDYAAASADASAFDAYHFINFKRLAHHLLNPGSGSALGSPGGNDPGGFSSLEMRGFAWNLLRWVADRYADAGGVTPGPGGPDARLFRELTTGGPDHLSGVDNLMRAIEQVSGETVRWEGLLAEYGLVPPLDDRGSPGLASSTQLATWNLRDVFRALHEETPDESPFGREYPLTVTEVELSSSTSQNFAFDIGSSAARYFELASQGGHPDIRFELTTIGGFAVPGRKQILIARLR